MPSGLPAATIRPRSRQAHSSSTTASPASCCCDVCPVPVGAVGLGNMKPRCHRLAPRQAHQAVEAAVAEAGDAAGRIPRSAQSSNGSWLPTSTGGAAAGAVGGRLAASHCSSSARWNSSRPVTRCAGNVAGLRQRIDPPLLQPQQQGHFRHGQIGLLRLGHHARSRLGGLCGSPTTPPPQAIGSDRRLTSLWRASILALSFLQRQLHGRG